LIGLQLPGIRASIRGYSLRELILDGVIFSVLLILLRLIWVFPGAWFSYFLRKRVAHQKEKRPPVRQIFVVGWTGMRGVVSLAAAISLPATLADGTAFPQRNIIVFLTFCVIVVTLVLQGLTLPPLIRWLGLAATGEPDEEELKARRVVLQAALTYLGEAKAKDSEDTFELYDDLVKHYNERLAGTQPDAEAHDRHIELKLQALGIERETAIRLRNEGTISDNVLRRIERELDLSESRLTGGEG
jgi:CPA1 family monovalent cation:H+ antiporter